MKLGKAEIRHYQYLSFLPETEMVFHHKSSNKPQIPFAPAFSGPIGYFPFSGGSSLFLPQMKNSISLEYFVAKNF